MSPEPIQSDVITEAQALVVAFESHLWLLERQRKGWQWKAEQWTEYIITHGGQAAEVGQVKAGHA